MAGIPGTSVRLTLLSLEPPMRQRIAVTAGLLVVLLVACDQTDAVRAPSEAPSPSGEAAAYSARLQGKVAAPVANSSSDAVRATWAQLKLIRSAELQVRVADVRKAIAAADRMAQGGEALLADVHVSKDEDGRQDARFVVRVRAERFGEMLAQLKSLGDVTTENSTTEDVSKAYADLETRLVVKDEEVRRLRALVNTRTAKLTDVLEVERELARAVGELEEMKGARRFYDQRVATSTISVSVVELGALLRPSLGAPIRAALRQSLEVLAKSVAMVIYLVVFLAPWTLLAALAWWGIRRWRARSFAA